MAERITSRSNQRLVAVRRVRDGLERGSIFVEGKRLVGEALDSGLDITEGFITECHTDEELAGRLRRAAPTFVLSESAFRSISDTDNPQGVAVVAKRPVCDEPIFRRGGLPLWIFLNEANNPANLGAITRTAEAAGVSGVIVSPGSADVYSPKSLRASMGSAFRQRIFAGVELTDAADAARKEGIRVLAAEPKQGTDHLRIDWRVPTLLVFGSEAHGLSQAEVELCDSSVAISIAESVESLNLAVSAAVILFEARRQIGG